MSLTINEFESILQLGENSSTTDSNLSNEILQLTQFFARESGSLQSILACVNKLILTSTNRDKSFEIINSVLPFIPADTVEDNAVNWCNFAVEYHQNANVSAARFQVLAAIVKISIQYRFQDFNKHMTTTLLKKIAEKCVIIEPHSELTIPILKLLITCLQSYSGSCGLFKTQIEKYLLQFVEINPSKAILELVGTCLHFLQQVGPSGQLNIVYCDNWSSQMRKLSATIHLLFDDIFENYTEFDDYKKLDGDFYEFQHSVKNSGSLNEASNNAKRINCLIIFLSQMLRNKYPVAKNITTQILLDIIKRGLLINIDDKKHFIDIHSNLLLVNIQISLLYLLRDLIAVLKGNSKLFSMEILRMFVDCLKRSNNRFYKKNCEFQIAIYKVFSYWISTVKCNISPSYQEKIFAHILNQIKPLKNTISLQIDAEIGKKSSKAKQKSVRQKIINSGKNNNSEFQTLGNYKRTEQICLHALEFMGFLLQNISVKITEKTCVALYDIITSTFHDLNMNKRNPPYTNSNCEMQLYNILRLIFDQPYLPLTLPISVAINIFSIGKFHNLTKIADVCKLGLRDLEKICQPICGTLYVEKTAVQSCENCKIIDKSLILNDLEENNSNGVCEDNETVLKENILLDEEIIDNVESKECFIEDAKRINVISDILISPVTISTENNSFSLSENAEKTIIINGNNLEEMTNGKVESSLNSRGNNEDIIEIVDDTIIELNSEKKGLALKNPRKDLKKKNDVVEINDSNPKKAKIMQEEIVEIDDEEDMFNTFKDVINEY